MATEKQIQKAQNTKNKLNSRITKLQDKLVKLAEKISATVAKNKTVVDSIYSKLQELNQKIAELDVIILGPVTTTTTTTLPPVEWTRVYCSVPSDTSKIIYLTNLTDSSVYELRHEQSQDIPVGNYSTTWYTINGDGYGEYSVGQSGGTFYISYGDYAVSFNSEYSGPDATTTTTTTTEPPEDTNTVYGDVYNSSSYEVVLTNMNGITQTLGGPNSTTIKTGYYIAYYAVYNYSFGFTLTNHGGTLSPEGFTSNEPVTTTEPPVYPVSVAVIYNRTGQPLTVEKVSGDYTEVSFTIPDNNDSTYGNYISFYEDDLVRLVFGQVFVPQLGSYQNISNSNYSDNTIEVTLFPGNNVVTVELDGSDVCGQVSSEFPQPPVVSVEYGNVSNTGNIPWLSVDTNTGNSFTLPAQSTTELPVGSYNIYYSVSGSDSNSSASLTVEYQTTVNITDPAEGEYGPVVSY